MNAVVDSSEEQVEETASAMATGQLSYTTTLYDLIDALQTTLEPGADGYVVETVTSWLRSGHIVLLGTDNEQADLSHRYSDCSHEFTIV